MGGARDGWWWEWLVIVVGGSGRMVDDWDVGMIGWVLGQSEGWCLR